MATFEDSYPNLLQGVSQQVPRDRLPGQVQGQVNMLSDMVTGLRRRPGAQYQYNMDVTGDTDSIKAWYTDIAGEQVHVILDCSDGTVRLLNKDFVLQATLAGGAYLTTSVPENIKAATVGEEMFLLNTAISPVYGSVGTGLTPNEQGCFYVSSGAFSYEYTVKIKSNIGTAVLTYQTPDGTTAGDAALATTEYIAEQLYDQLALLDGFDVDAGATEVLGYLATADVNMLKVISASTDSGSTARSQQDAIELIEPNVAAIVTLVTEVITQYPGDLVAAQTAADDAYVLLLAMQADVEDVPDGSKLSEAIKAIKAAVKSATTLMFTVKTAVPSAGTLSWLSLYRLGNAVYIRVQPGTGPLSVSSPSGLTHLVPSKDSYFTSTGVLPPILPEEADGYIVRVGDITYPAYYQYNSTRQVWLECGAYGSPTSLADMPVAVAQDSGNWVIRGGVYEGRNAGDSESNPDFYFLRSSITGIASYQGRLVLLSGSRACLSAAGKPRRFYRSTVVSLLDGDPIEVGSSSNSSAAYSQAVQFMKDLILFSDSHQAVIPHGNTAISPRTASLVGTSDHATDTTSIPIPLGRTLMFAGPRSKDFFGMWEMVPSQFAETQYVSVDVTAHIPKYMGGRCRFGASSGVSGVALFGPSGDKQTLIVHEYVWDADTKQQQAWHQWTFPYEVAAAYFANEIINILFVRNGVLVGCTIDPRVGTITANAERRPFLDMYSTLAIVDHVVPPPAWLLDFDATAYTQMTLAVVSGDLAGEPVGFSIDGANLVTVRSFPSGDVALGFPYRSNVVPTRPVLKDRNDHPITATKFTVLRYLVSTANSAEYNAAVSDLGQAGTDVDVGTLYYSSSELELGQAREATESLAVVPARTNASSTILELYTEGTGELNITALDYVGKYHQKIRRR